MKRRCKALICMVLVLTMTMGSFNEISVIAAEKTSKLTSEQSNAIEMLNYITVLTQEINDSKNSRIYMEDAYSSLINNTYPNAVDKTTLSQMSGLLDTMENYRMIDVKRDRLKYVYEQNQAEAIRAAIPNPMGLISAVGSFSPVKLISSIAYMAVDSATSYKAYTTEAEKEYLQEGWALDDEEAEVLHESRKGTFNYMIRMVNDYDLPGDLTLTEKTVEEFVKWKNDSNVSGRVMFLESNENTYQSYGGYWLVRAESYYNDGKYQECLDDIAKYEAIDAKIFRKDYDLAAVLPLAIAAAKKNYKIDKYAPYATKHAQIIIDNTDHDDWALRYFAAQTLVDLYSETKNKTYLDQAYTIVRDNVLYLLSEQKSQNEAYLNPVEEVVAGKGATKEEKEEIKRYNKMQKESRKSEMPPVVEPLLLNCELLFAIADEKKLSTDEKTNIDKTLHPNGDKLFLVKSIDDQFWFDKSKVDTSKDSATLTLDKSGITLPAQYFTKDSNIKVTVLNADGTKAGEFTDWTVDSVKRNTEGDISTFYVKYTSPTFKKFAWKPNMKIQVDVECLDGLDVKYHYDYHTVGTKNQWYDYGKVWESGVVFEAGK